MRTNIIPYSLLLLLFAVESLVYAKDPESISIYQDPQFRQQRDCVRDCISRHHGAEYRGLAAGLGCGRSHSCFCREDLQPSASSYLSGCFAEEHTSCNGGPDLASAIFIYESYCGFVGPATVSATTTGASPQGTSDDGPVVTAADGPAVTLGPQATVTVVVPGSSPRIRPDMAALSVTIFIAAIFTTKALERFQYAH